MLRCWRQDPNLRPNFSQLVNDTSELLEKSFGMVGSLS